MNTNIIQNLEMTNLPNLQEKINRKFIKLYFKLDLFHKSINNDSDTKIIIKKMMLLNKFVDDFRMNIKVGKNREIVLRDEIFSDVDDESFISTLENDDIFENSDEYFEEENEDSDIESEYEYLGTEKQKADLKIALSSVKNSNTNFEKIDIEKLL